MEHFLAIQHTYETVEIGLFENQTILQTIVETKKHASKNIVVLVKTILQDNNISFDDLSFFAANQGPGPFTTLRVVIATINGLAFATCKPIIGIDGLDAFLEEQKNSEYPITVALLNAYSNDVYFGIQNNGQVEKGYKNIDLFLESLKNKLQNKPIRFIGQAVDLYNEKILKTFGDNTFIPTPTPQTCSIEQIGAYAYNSWGKKKNLSERLLPLYLKSMRMN